MSTSAARKGAPAVLLGTREESRNLRVSSRVPLGNPTEAVQELISRVTAVFGYCRKTAAAECDVGASQFGKWANDGDLPSLRQVLRLVEIAGPGDPFRKALISHLRHLFDPPSVDPDEVAARIEQQLRGKPYAREAADAARQALLYDEPFNPTPKKGRR